MAVGEARGRGSSRCTGPRSLTAPEQAPVRAPEASLHLESPSERDSVRASHYWKGTGFITGDPKLPCGLLSQAYVTTWIKPLPVQCSSLQLFMP